MKLIMKRSGLARHLTPLGITLPPILPHPEYQPPAFAFTVLPGSMVKVRNRGEKKMWLLGVAHAIMRCSPPRSKYCRGLHGCMKSGLATVFIWTPGQLDNRFIAATMLIADGSRANGLTSCRFARHLKRLASFGGRTSLIRMVADHFAAASPGGVLGLFADSSSLPSPIQWGPLEQADWSFGCAKVLRELSDAVNCLRA
jgi:hypothetical protein